MFKSAVLVLFLLLGMSGCSTKKDDSFVESIFQTTGAEAVREHTNILRKSLLDYLDKLNKRNPSFYSKQYAMSIKDEIENSSDNVVLPLLAKKSNATYKDYFNIAFSEEYVSNRNDYLIVGIYKLLYWAYTMDRAHTITTLQYDAKKLQEANRVMQIIQYRIQEATDHKGNYLFITWQRPWQVKVLKEISKKKNRNLKIYSDEELLYHSNMSFQVISSNMIFTIQETLRYLGVEGTNLSLQTIKSILVFL